MVVENRRCDVCSECFDVIENEAICTRCGHDNLSEMPESTLTLIAEHKKQKAAAADKKKEERRAVNFLSQLSKIVNTGQSRSVILTGNIYDLFFDGSKYVPLIEFLKTKLKAEPSNGQKGLTQVVCQINRPIEVVGGTFSLDQAWAKLHPSDTKSLCARLKESNESTVYAFELLRQMSECTRNIKTDSNLLVLVEAADMLVPENEISKMSSADRRVVGVIHDWFSDPDFMNGHDTVILFAESRSNIHNRVSRLPNVLSVDIPLPDLELRLNFIVHFASERQLTISAKEVAEQTSGLSLHAIRQLLCSGDYSAKNISSKVEDYMISQLGDGVIEFKRPTHTIASVIGNSLVKKFIATELIPGFKSDGKTAIAGAAVAGAIGGGKTYICEAVASELGIPVIVLKNIRSKWYGETDQIFERLRRLLETFHKIVIFVDEADTMFGDIQSDQDTERRLTGKIQSMMSDPELKGRVIWFLMTARIHRLSPDIRRPGRIDLILPILDPEGEDKIEFLLWALDSIENISRADLNAKDIMDAVKGYSAASYALLRNRINAAGCKNMQDVVEVARDIILPDIESVREYQTIQAKLNCTRRSLLVPVGMSDSEFKTQRESWQKRAKQLEDQGIK